MVVAAAVVVRRRGLERPDLTARGLAQLSKTPEAVRPPTKTLGERIVSWTREAGCGAAIEAVRALIAQALG